MIDFICGKLCLYIGLYAVGAFFGLLMFAQF